jgi:eukaryotic-like serine/threonine-protein kinase
MRRVGGRFTLENGIAVGGVATVYLGCDEVLDRPVAVKILHPGFEDSDLAHRFEREGSLAARLSHPNIVQVYDAGKESDEEGRETSYIVMEHVPGGDLKDLMDEKGPLPEPELSRIGADLAAGLAHAHERGIIHRDIKPQNVLLDERGRPKLTDFGIARATDETRATPMTASYLGTALYSSPEQLQNESVTEKSDVYSLGTTLYEAAVGSPVFEGTVFQVASSQVNEKPVPPTERGAEMCGEFEGVILSCLAKNPEDRPSASELRDMLEAVSAGRKVGARSSGKRSLATVAGVALVLVLLGAAAMLGATSMLGFGERQAGREEQGRESEPPVEQEQASSSGPPDDDPDEDGNSADLTEDAAAGTVATMYLLVVRGEYERSYGYLSEEYRREEFPTRADWEENFSDLRAITFTETPVARVSGEGEAVVTGETASIMNDGEATGESGEWNLVAEDGEWKIDGMEFRERRAGDEV